VDLKKIVGQHKSSVALVFKRMGLTSPVTTKDVLLATVLYGDRFVNDLEAQILADSGYTGFLGPLNDEPTGTMAQVKTLPTVTVKAQQKAAKVTNTLKDILSVVATGIGAYSAAKKTGSTPTPSNNYTPRNDEPKKKSNTAFLIASLVLIVVLALLVFNNQNK